MKVKSFNKELASLRETMSLDSLSYSTSLLVSRTCADLGLYDTNLQYSETKLV